MKQFTKTRGGGGAVYLGAFESANLMGITFLVMNLILLVMNGAVVHHVETLAGDRSGEDQDALGERDRLVRFDASTAHGNNAAGYQPVVEVTHRLVRISDPEPGKAWVILTEESLPSEAVRFRQIE